MKRVYFLLAAVVTQTMSLVASTCDSDEWRGDDVCMERSRTIVIGDGKQDLPLAANGDCGGVENGGGTGC